MDSGKEEESKAGIRWCISVDGSDICEDAFATVFHNLRKPEDYTIVSHVYSDSKDYLSYKYKPKNIKQDYDAQLSGTHTSKWALVFQPIEDKKTTKEQMVSIAEDYRADVLVLGYHGRKGVKEDPTLLGSNAEKIASDPI